MTSFVGAVIRLGRLARVRWFLHNHDVFGYLTTISSRATEAACEARRERMDDLFPPHFQQVVSIATGGMGTIYRAFDTNLNREVALKTLLSNQPGPESVLRFKHEIKALSKLHHPSIVPILSSGVTNAGMPYFCMPYVSGLSLDQKLASEDLPFSLRLRFAREACDAVAYLHDKGILHRDLKTSNFMVTDEAEPRLVLLDLGIAKILSDPSAVNLTRTNSVIGTIAYMPPEVRGGQKGDYPADVFSLGCVLSVLFGNELPPVSFDPGDFEKWWHNIKLCSAPSPQIYADTRQVIQRAVAYDSRNRYQNAGLLRRDLDLVGSGQIQSGPAVIVPRRRWDGARWAIVAAVFLAFTGGGIIIYNNATKTSQSAESLLSDMAQERARLSALVSSAEMSKDYAAARKHILETARLMAERTPTSRELSRVAEQLADVDITSGVVEESDIRFVEDNIRKCRVRHLDTDAAHLTFKLARLQDILHPQSPKTARTFQECDKLARESRASLDPVSMARFYFDYAEWWRRGHHDDKRYIQLSAQSVRHLISAPDKLKVHPNEVLRIVQSYELATDGHIEPELLRSITDFLTVRKNADRAHLFEFALLARMLAKSDPTGSKKFFLKCIAEGRGGTDPKVAKAYLIHQMLQVPGLRLTIDEKERWAKEAYLLCHGSENWHARIISCGVLADVSLEAKNYDESKRAYLEARELIRIRRKIEPSEELARMLWNNSLDLGDAAFANKDYQVARDCLDQCKALMVEKFERLDSELQRLKDLELRLKR